MTTKNMPLLNDNMFFTFEDNTYRFELHTDPPEAMYWSTYKVKASHLKVFDANNKQVFGPAKEALLNDLDEERKFFTNRNR
jgi:hypothetical protein